MRKKIIFFIPSGCGGAERQAIVISKCLDDEEFDISYQIFGPSNQLEKFLPLNRTCVFLQIPKFSLKLIVYMRKIIKEEKPDIVYGSCMPVNWRLILAAHFMNCKVVLRNDNYLYTQSLAQKLRLAMTYPFADYIIAQTDEMKMGLIKGLCLSNKLVHTVQNAIDKQYIDKCLLDKNPYDDACDIRFVAVGRFHRDKGFDLLLQAFQLVKKEIENSIMYIVGDFNPESTICQELINYVKHNNLQDSVVFTGFKNNPYVYMKYANCFVLSSRNEGLPNVMIEALALGTPVAAFKCIPVIERIVSEGKSGYLADKENVEELAEAMLKATKLGRIETTYKAGSEEKFRKIFRDL